MDQKSGMSQGPKKLNFLDKKVNVQPATPNPAQNPAQNPRNPAPSEQAEKPTIPNQKPGGNGGNSGVPQQKTTHGYPVAAPNWPFAKPGPQSPAQVVVKPAPFAAPATMKPEIRPPQLGTGKPIQEPEVQNVDFSAEKVGLDDSHSSSVPKPGIQNIESAPPGSNIAIQKPGNSLLEANPGFNKPGNAPFGANPWLQKTGNGPFESNPALQKPGNAPPGSNPVGQKQGNTPPVGNPGFQKPENVPFGSNPWLQKTGNVPFGANPVAQKPGNVPFPANPGLQKTGNVPFDSNPAIQKPENAPPGSNPVGQKPGNTPPVANPGFQKFENAPSGSNPGYPPYKRGVNPASSGNVPPFAQPARLADPKNVSGREESGSFSGGRVQEPVPMVRKPPENSAESSSGEKLEAGTGTKPSGNPFPFLHPPSQKVGPASDTSSALPFLNQQPPKMGNFPFGIEAKPPFFQIPDPPKQGQNQKQAPFTPFMAPDPGKPVPSYVKIDPGQSQSGSIKGFSQSEGGNKSVSSSLKLAEKAVGSQFDPYPDPAFNQAYSNQESLRAGDNLKIIDSKAQAEGLETSKETEGLNMSETSHVYRGAKEEMKEWKQFQQMDGPIDSTSVRGGEPQGREYPKPQIYRPPPQIQPEERKLHCQLHNSAVPEKSIYSQFYCPLRCSICIACVKKEVSSGEKKCPLCQRLYGRAEMTRLKNLVLT